MERISAFMDGESAYTETQTSIQRLKQDNECTETWATFHLIGDMMRGDPLLRGDFMARLHARMEQEPTQLAPRMTWRKTASYALSAAASLSAIAVVVALTFADNPLRPQAPIASSQPVRPLPAVASGKVNEYLLAHQEYSPSNALQGLAPYVRTVSESHDGNNR